MQYYESIIHTKQQQMNRNSLSTTPINISEVTKTEFRTFKRTDCTFRLKVIQLGNFLTKPTQLKITIIHKKPLDILKSSRIEAGLQIAPSILVHTDYQLDCYRLKIHHFQELIFGACGKSWLFLCDLYFSEIRKNSIIHYLVCALHLHLVIFTKRFTFLLFLSLPVRTF